MAPAPVKESDSGAGGLSQAVQSVASPGMSRMPASTVPTRERRPNVEPCN